MHQNIEDWHFGNFPKGCSVSPEAIEFNHLMNWLLIFGFYLIAHSDISHVSVFIKNLDILLVVIRFACINKDGTAEIMQRTVHIVTCGFVFNGFTAFYRRGH